MHTLRYYLGKPPRKLHYDNFIHHSSFASSVGNAYKASRLAQEWIKKQRWYRKEQYHYEKKGSKTKDRVEIVERQIRRHTLQQNEDKRRYKSHKALRYVTKRHFEGFFLLKSVNQRWREAWMWTEDLAWGKEEELMFFLCSQFSSPCQASEAIFKPSLPINPSSCLTDRGRGERMERWGEERRRRRQKRVVFVSWMG